MNICFVRIFSIPLALDVKINTTITHRVAWITLTYRVSLTILGSCTNSSLGCNFVNRSQCRFTQEHLGSCLEVDQYMIALSLLVIKILYLKPSFTCIVIIQWLDHPANATREISSRIHIITWMTFLTKYAKPKENTHQSCRLLYRIFICFFIRIHWYCTVFSPWKPRSLRHWKVHWIW